VNRDPEGGRLVLTGATGNTGLAVTTRLCRRVGAGRLLALVRPTTRTAPLEALGVAHAVVDLESPASAARLFRPGDVLVEMANLRHAPPLLEAMAAAGASRAFLVTTTAVFSSHHSFSALYRDIEARIRASAPVATILRPSMIYGNERDHNMHRLLRTLARVPAFPVFGSGASLMQPVHVEDLADGVVAAVERDARGEYNLAGPEPIPYSRVIVEASAALGRRVPLLRLPLGPVAAAVRVAERLPGFPITHEQVLRLQEDKAFDIRTSARDLGYAPRPFATGVREEVARLRAVGVLAR
jgi:uncharacterized protein YbjT (DUF2867 family)